MLPHNIQLIGAFIEVDPTSSIHSAVVLSGPPGPPDSVMVEEITDSTAQLSWSPGRDNGSPITGYVIQARTPFTVGWQAVDTGTIYSLHEKQYTLAQ